ncbi:MAG: DUF748 domain-containing protein [Gammaproteobacteria bacterium]|nr:DUF748 domain-containing protein [Gammaproteobacteria bacterium]
MKRVFVRLLQVVMLLLLLAFIALYLATQRFVAETLYAYLKQQGASNIVLGDLSLDLLLGKASLFELNFNGKNGQPVKITYASVNLSWIALTQEKIVFTQINIHQSDLPIRIADNRVSIAGIPLPGEHENSNIWPVSFEQIDGRDNKIALTYDNQTYDLAIRQLLLRQTGPSSLKLDVSLKHKSTELRTQGNISWKPSVALDLNIDAEKLFLQDYTGVVSLPEAIDFDGELKGNISLKWQNKALEINGEVRSDDFNLQLPSDLLLHADKAVWQGHYTVSPSQPWQLFGDLHLYQAFLQNEPAKYRYIHTDHIVAQELMIDSSESITAGSIVADYVDAFGPTEGASKSYLLSAESLQLNDNVLKQLQRLDVGAANIRGATIRITRNPQKKIEELLPYAATQTDQSDTESLTEKKRETEKSPFVYHIQQLDILADSRLQFTDNSITPDAKLLIMPLEIQATNVNSNDEVRAKVTVNATINRYASLHAEGEMFPLSPTKLTDLDAEIRDLELPALSGYSAKNGGFNIKRGLLNSTSKIHIERQKLRIDNQVFITNFALENLLAQQEQNEDLGHIGMPLNQGLRLLKDKNGDVRFSLPIRGNIDNPDISYRDITQQAVKGASQGAAILFLQQFLQPWSSIYAITKFSIGQFSSTRLQPITFSANDKQLSDDMQAYLAKLAELLTQKDDLRLEICGVSGKADAEKLQGKDPQLSQTELSQIQLRLAEQRAQLIKQQLVETHGIKPSRLFICQARIDDNPKGEPRVSLRL